MYDWSAYSQKLRSDVLADRGKWEREGANNMDYLQIEKVIGREIHRFQRQSDRRSRSVSGRRYYRQRYWHQAELPQESLKRWNFVTAIKNVIGGKGVSKAVENINTVINEALTGMDASDIYAVDSSNDRGRRNKR